MPTPVSHTSQKIPLNSSRLPRSYTALIKTTEIRKKQTMETTILWQFRLACFGAHPQGGLGYKVQTQKRLLLDSKNRPIQSFNKAQAIALKTASINNKLVFRVSPYFGVLEVVNTQQIREKWAKLKTWLLETYPDLKPLAADFDWQLQEERIQERYIADPFCSFFFGDFFDRALPYSDKKWLANGLGIVDLPVRRVIKIRGEKPEAVQLKGKLDTEATNFPMEKMDAFLGQLLNKSGIQQSLMFDYTGNYSIHPETGFITEASFNCATEINKIYSKTIRITLNLEADG